MTNLDHAAPDGVLIAHGGVELDGLHGHGLLVVIRAEVFEKVLDVLDAEEAVDVEEHFGLIGRKEWRQEAFGSAAPPLVFAGGAGLAGATLNGHLLVKSGFIFKCSANPVFWIWRGEGVGKTE